MEVSSKTLEATTNIPPSTISPLPQISSEEIAMERTKGRGGLGNFTVPAQEPESLTILQKKFRRAQRFGMPVLLSEEEKRMNRAERFGTGPTLQRKSEEQKRKDRAERFGITVQSGEDEEEKKKARLARFAQVPKLSSAEEQKRNARAVRFSSQGASTLSLHLESTMPKEAQMK